MAAKRAPITARRRVALGALAAAIVVIAGGTVWALTRGGGTAYRTALAERATVTQTLSSVGTVSSANRASVSFPVSGTVATVPVALGDHVSAGQTVATLATSTLQQSVDSASATLATSQQKLATDTASQSASATNASSASSISSTSSTSSGLSTDSLTAQQLTGTPSSAPRGGTGHSSGSGGPPASQGVAGGGGIAGLQQAVIAAQHQLDALLRSINLAACRQSTTTTFSVDGVTASGTTVSVTVTVPAGTTADLVDNTGNAVPSASAPLTVSGNTFTFAPIDTTTYPGPYSVRFSLPPTQSLSGSCVAADLQALQQQVAAAEAQLNAAIANLTKALAAQQSTTTHSSAPSQHKTAAAGSGGSSGGTGGSSSAGGSGQHSSAGSGAGSGAGAGTVPTAADLAADQAHIDAAAANLQVAQQDLAAATLTTPIAGTVADVTLSAGQSVGAASQTARITIVGSGTTLVQTTVAITNLDAVKVGEQAQVVVDGNADPIAATVSQIGVLDSTTGTTTTYPVTLQLAPTAAHLFDGAGADVTITVQSLPDVLSVPTSAVHSVGSLHTVEVLTGSTLSTVRVGIGAIGDERTQITSGLTAGQRVVLANLSTPLPSNNTNLRRLTGIGSTSSLTGSGFAGRSSTRGSGG